MWRETKILVKVLNLKDGGEGPKYRTYIQYKLNFLNINIEHILKYKYRTYTIKVIILGTYSVHRQFWIYIRSHI